MINLFFILGAPDIEMSEIEAALKKVADDGKIAGYGFAMADDGKRVHAGNAYRATECEPCPQGEGFAICEIECHVSPEWGQHPYTKAIDHHKVGDSGFGMPAEKSFEASSLGQLLNTLKIKPTARQIAICAADHNLSAAYAGEVSGVTAEQVFEVRLPELMSRNHASTEEVKAGIRIALEMLAKAPKVQIGGAMVADIRAQVLPYAVEAGTMKGVEFLGRVDTRDEKKVFLSGKPETVSAFLAKPIDGITGVYGDPARGFAGGSMS